MYIPPASFQDSIIIIKQHKMKMIWKLPACLDTVIFRHFPRFQKYKQHHKTAVNPQSYHGIELRNAVLSITGTSTRA